MLEERRFGEAVQNTGSSGLGDESPQEGADALSSIASPRSR